MVGALGKISENFSKETLGSSSLTRSELETVLHEVELSINSRRLIFICDEEDTGYHLHQPVFSWKDQ